MYSAKWFDKAHAQDAFALRLEVFVQEQHFENEFDEIDEYADHVVLYDEKTPIAVGRCYVQQGSVWRIGRLAVKKAWRKKGIGSMIMQELEAHCRQRGATFLVLDAQVQAAPFYASLGYEKAGQEHMDEHCPHVFMQKSL